MAVNKDTAVNTTAAPAAEAPAMAKGPNPVKRFLREVWIELKKTNWPSWSHDMPKFTVIVLTTVFVVAIYLWLGDQLFGTIADKLFNVTKSAGL